MATVLDTKLLPVATRLLTRFGKDITYVAKGQLQYDPTEGDVCEESADVPHVVKSIPPGNYSTFFAAGTLTLEDMFMTGVAGQNLAFTPKPGMMAIVDNARYRIRKAIPVYSGESIALWMFSLGDTSDGI